MDARQRKPAPIPPPLPHSTSKKEKVLCLSFAPAEFKFGGHHSLNIKLSWYNDPS